MTDETQNTDLEALEALVTLAAQFKQAAEARLEDPALKAKAVASLKPGEMEVLQEKAMELAAGGLAAMFDGVDEEFLKLNLEVCDMVEELSERVLDKDELAGYLPEGLQNQDAVDALKAQGADNLAALCEHKLSM